jgi:hypothetical protein
MHAEAKRVAAGHSPQVWFEGKQRLLVVFVRREAIILTRRKAPSLRNVGSRQLQLIKSIKIYFGSQLLASRRRDTVPSCD